jgi:hypothetical protein
MRRWPKTSFSRGLTGLHAIHALAAHAADHDTTCRRELQRFVASARRGRGSIELFRGLAGRLAGAAIVMRSVAEPAVRALGDELADRIMEQLAARDRGAARAARLSPRGVAHGWPGVVLGARAWLAVARSLPAGALLGGVSTARREVSASIDRGRIDWAHGHAGMALLFARAYLQLGDPRFLAWARGAAAEACARPTRDLSLVSGATGIAYAMLAVAAADPDGPWREAAWTIAGQVLAAVDIPAANPHGVWSGLGGVCCLALDLMHGTEAGFPGIEA